MNSPKQYLGKHLNGLSPDNPLAAPVSLHTSGAFSANPVISGDETFGCLLQNAEKTTRRFYAHGCALFHAIAETLVIKGDSIPHPLLQFMSLPQNYAEELLYKEAFIKNIAKFDLTFSITRTADLLEDPVVYSTGFFSDEFVARMVELLNSVVKYPAKNRKITNVN